MDDLDRLDLARFDVEAVVERANRHAQLAQERQDRADFFEFTGLNDAEHILTQLLPELHNLRFVVRDIDGQLKFVFEDLRAAEFNLPRWAQRLLIRENLMSDEEIGALAPELSADPELVLRIVRTLPSDPSHRLDF